VRNETKYGTETTFMQPLNQGQLLYETRFEPKGRTYLTVVRVVPVRLHYVAKCRPIR